MEEKYMRRGEAVMASFQLFARHESGHLGNTNLAARERNTRKEKRAREQEGEEGEDDGKQGRRAEERVDKVQTNGEKGVFLSLENKCPSVF